MNASLRESLRRVVRHRLAWPVVTLVMLLAINAIFNPNFLHLEVRSGHLYGSLIDILNRAAPLVLVSLGMTLVIATRGIDVAAKQEIMEQILRLARAGMAVIFISSEMSEVVRVAHRIVVLRDRRKVGELPAGSSEDAVYELIAAEHE